MKPESLIFDIDGTLWDSRSIIVEGYNQVLTAAGHEDLCVTAEDLKRLFGKTMKEIADIMLTTLPEEERYPLMEKCIDTGDARLLDDPCDIGYPGVVETLEELSKRYPMVLVTNFYGNMPVVLKEFGLERYFKSIVESSVVGLRKPDPALFALGVEALPLPAEEIIVIGDSYRKDIHPASTLGCRTVWLKNICWEDEPIIDGHAPTAIIDDIAQLPDAIAAISSQEP